MITEEKIKIYLEYKGDIDSWSKMGSKKEKTVIVDNDWYLIDNIVQDIHLIRKKLVSLEYENNFNSNLKQILISEKTMKKLEEYEKISNPSI